MISFSKITGDSRWARAVSMTGWLTLLVLFLTLYAARLASEFLVVVILMAYGRWVISSKSHCIWFWAYLAWWISVCLPVDVALRSDSTFSARWEHVVYRQSAAPTNSLFVIYAHRSGITDVAWAFVLRLPVRTTLTTPFF